MFKIRTSKYRHVFCDQPKPEECWTDFRLATTTGDQQYIKASAKYFAFAMQGGGGPMIVHRHDRPGRFEMGSSPSVSGHAGNVLDIDWNPFDDSLMATASEDTIVKLWRIPDDWEPTDEKGMPKPGDWFKDSLTDLIGHQKKVTLLRHNPTADKTLLSCSADYTIKLWDCETSQCVNSYEECPNLIHDIVWDTTGDMYASSCKDKNVRIVDARTAGEGARIEKAHDGAKSVKLVFVNDTGKMYSLGANKQSGREIKVWDMKDLSKPVHTEKIDTAAGAMIPLWDPDTNVLYQCGKGDGIVRLYEYEDKSPYIFKLNDGFRSNTPGKGYCMLPKRGLDVAKHETVRILKLTTDQVHPLRFFVPRKSDLFQDDINPPTAAAKAAHTHKDWMGGSSKNPVKMYLNPKEHGKIADENAPVKKKAFKSATELSKELEEAKKKIASLENGGGTKPAPTTDNDSKKKIADLEAKLKASEESAAAKVAELETKLKESEAAAASIAALEAKESEAMAARISELEAKLKENNIQF